MIIDILSIELIYYSDGRRIRTSSCEQDLKDRNILPSSFGTCVERRKIAEQDRNISFYSLLSSFDTYERRELLSRTEIHLLSLRCYSYSSTHCLDKLFRFYYYNSYEKIPLILGVKHLKRTLKFEC